MLRRLCISAVVILMMPQLSTLALSWGADGHRTVGAIADLLLESHPATRDRVKQILGGKSLSEVSVFADCAKGFRYCHRNPSAEEKAFTARNTDHHNYHYTDVPIQQDQYRAGTAGTTNDDVVQVIHNAIQVLRGHAPPAGPIELNQREALWVLVHLVGDIQQPLHVGAIYYDQECDKIVDPNVVGANQKKFGIGGSFLGTTGGNDLMITETENLHHYWDDTTVVGAMRLRKIKGKSIDDFAAAIVAHPPTGWQSQGAADTWPERWATESLLLAREALTEPDIGDASQKTGEKGATCTAPVSIDGDYKKTGKPNGSRPNRQSRFPALGTARRHLRVTATKRGRFEHRRNVLQQPCRKAEL